MEMCERWQRRNSAQFSLWLLPRGHLKTSIFTEAGTLWDLLNEPDDRHLIVNAKLDNAEDILANIKNCIETNEIFRWLFPEYCPDLAPKSLRQRCKWLNTRIDLPCSRRAGRKEGSIQIMSVNASLVSKHYDKMTFDDPVNDENTTTKELRDKVDRWYRNALQLREDAKSRIRLIGTRWHFDDLYSRIIKLEMNRRKKQQEKGDKVTPRYWIYHRQVVERVEESGSLIANYESVQPIWPERFTASDIEDIREETGSYIFSCQYMNNPLPEDDAIFKYTDINQIDEYDIPENVDTYMACDIAVEETEQGDYWVISVASFDTLGRMYVREVIRERMLTSSFLEHVTQLVKKWHPSRVGIENTAFQKTLNKTYREYAATKGINIPWHELERGKSSKRKRIMALQPRVERGDFYVDERMKNLEYVIEEMTTYPRAPFDDVLDTMADLESMFYSGPEVAKQPEATNTYNAYHGSLEDDEDTHEDASSIIEQLV
jgi:predicted phage terminase large subunit-like protein